MTQRHRRSAMRALLAAAVLAGGVGCSTGEVEDPAPPRAAEAAVSCGDVRAQGFCHVTEADAGRQFRYAVVEPTGGAGGTGATLVDLGGPGTTLFGVDWPGERLQSVADHYSTTVVALEEPWVTTPYPDGCREAAAGWFAAVHAGERGGAADFAERCELADRGWGWTPDSYRAALDAVLTEQSLQLDRYVGLSFAGQRVGYLEEVPDEVVLSSPQTVGGTAAGYLADRGTAAVEACSTSTSPATCRRFGGGLETNQRSLPLTSFDIGAAWVATGYQQPAARYRSALADVAGNAAVVGALSDSATGRFGVSDVSPATFAYFAEVCPQARDWPQEPPAGATLAEEFLTAWHTVCGSVTTDAYDAVRRPARPADLCLVVSERDGVVPATSSLGDWRGVADRTVRLPSARHAPLDDDVLGRCDAG